MSVQFGGSVHEWVAVPLLDEREVRFDTSEDAILDHLRLRLPFVPSTTQAIFLNTPLLLNRRQFPFNTLLPLIDHLCEGLPLLLSLLLRNTHRLNRFLDCSLMSLVLVVDLCLCHLDQLLELGNLVFGKLNRVLSRGLLSLKGSGELECRFKLAGEGFEAVDDVVWNLRSWL